MPVSFHFVDVFHSPCKEIRNALRSHCISHQYTGTTNENAVFAWNFFQHKIFWRKADDSMHCDKLYLPHTSTAESSVETDTSNSMCSCRILFTVKLCIFRVRLWCEHWTEWRMRRQTYGLPASIIHAFDSVAIEIVRCSARVCASSPSFGFALLSHFSFRKCVSRSIFFSLSFALLRLQHLSFCCLRSSCSVTIFLDAFVYREDFTRKISALNFGLMKMKWNEESS